MLGDEYETEDVDVGLCLYMILYDNSSFVPPEFINKGAQLILATASTRRLAPDSIINHGVRKAATREWRQGTQARVDGSMSLALEYVL